MNYVDWRNWAIILAKRAKRAALKLGDSMETGLLELNKTEVKYSLLKHGSDSWMQFWYTIIPEESAQVADQIRALEVAEAELLKKFRISGNSVAVKRFFSSDLISHREEILGYKERQGTDFFLSMTEQPPAANVKLALLGMCLSNITSKVRNGETICLNTTSDVKHIFAEHLIDPEANESSNSERQTSRVFALLREKLYSFGASIEKNVLRTWLYAPHVDADYPGIVKARKELFDKINLTKDTHYIASTGIQGGSGSRFARVFMDAYALVGVPDSAIRYIQAPAYLSPTHIYGVTFERATAVTMGKTDFMFISGTASIDKDGNIVHPGDVAKQTERTLSNIAALLDSAGFGRGDLSSFIVYLRDAADLAFVKPAIDSFAGNLPTIYVRAPVCRPGWLIEIEATAARPLA